MPLDLTVLDDAAPAPAGGAPLDLPIDTIDEDPEQPRFEFGNESLAELAETIRQRGVRQPVSVRPHPVQPGRWMLNFGARRLRASRMAGRETVPAFVDLAADSYDQVIENEQRQNLQPLELALFVQRRMRAGETQADIARRLGKSRGYVTFVSALIDAPDPVMALYRSGRCRGLTELYELRRLYEAEPQAVTEWLGSAEKVTRAEVERLKADLLLLRDSAATLAGQEARVDASESAGDAGETQPTEPPAPPPSASGAAPAAADAQPAVHRASPARSPWSLTLFARLDGADVAVDLRSLPAQDGQVFVRLAGAKQPVAVDLERLDALRLAWSAT